MKCCVISFFPIADVAQVPFPRVTGGLAPGEHEEGYNCDANLARLLQFVDAFSLGNPVLVARAALMVSVRVKTERDVSNGKEQVLCIVWCPPEAHARVGAAAHV